MAPSHVKAYETTAYEYTGRDVIKDHIIYCAKADKSCMNNRIIVQMYRICEVHTMI